MIPYCVFMISLNFKPDNRENKTMTLFLQVKQSKSLYYHSLLQMVIFHEIPSFSPTHSHFQYQSQVYSFFIVANKGFRKHTIDWVPHPEEVRVFQAPPKLFNYNSLQSGFYNFASSEYSCLFSNYNVLGIAIPSFHQKLSNLNYFCFFINYFQKQERKLLILAVLIKTAHWEHPSELL